MKLTEKALLAIKDKQTRLKLALLLGKTEQSVNNYIKKNDPVLTRADVIDLITRETGLKQKDIIIREEEIKA